MSLAKPTPKEHKPRLHLDYLDGLRAVAALYVVFHHAALATGLVLMAPLMGVAKHVAWSLSFGHYAVGLFIVLSGFCLMLPVARNAGTLPGGALRFFKKRARRILPPYFGSIVVSLVLIKLFAINQATPRDLGTHLFLVQDVFDDTATTINGVYWSISVEWRIYFLFPLLVWAWRKWGAATTVFVATIVAYSGVVVVHRIDSHFYSDLNSSAWGLCPQYLALFAMGMLAAELACSNSAVAESAKRVPLRLITGLLALVILVLSLPRVSGRLPLQTEFVDFFLGICAAGLLISCGGEAHEGPVFRVARILSWPPLVFAGTFAYSIYLIHALVLGVLWKYAVLPLHLPPLAAFATICVMGVPTVLVCSYAFFLACERPFLGKARKNAEGIPLVTAAEPAP